MDHVIGFLDSLAIVGRGNLDDAVVVDIHLGAGHFHDFTDDFTARPDDFADLVGWNLHGLNARCVDREIAAPELSAFVHLAQDMHPPIFGLCQRFFHDLGRDTRDLDVHLQRGDTVFGARHLEVHVTQVIFVTQNVGQDRILTRRLPGSDPWQHRQPVLSAEHQHPSC